MSIFIDGLNDFYQNDDNPIFTDRIKGFIDSNGYSEVITTLPIAKAAKRVADMLNEQGGRCEDNIPSSKYNDPKIIDAVIKRYLSNKTMIEAIAAKYGIKPIFVWQPVPTYKYDQSSHLFAKANDCRHSYSIYGYPAIAKIAKETPFGKDFLWCADIQEGVKEPLYVDAVHYTAVLSKSIAECIGTLIAKDSLVQGR